MSVQSVIFNLSFVIEGGERARPTCHLRFTHDMVRDFPLLLPRGVTVAQVTLDHFVMVRIHARQLVENEQVMQ